MQTNTPSGEDLRDKGMQASMDAAGKPWCERAYEFLLTYSRSAKYFMAEEVRRDSEGFLEEPPSNRAWGGVISKAAKAGMIRHVGYRKVKNPKAHCTPASVWMSNNSQKEKS